MVKNQPNVMIFNIGVWHQPTIKLSMHLTLMLPNYLHVVQGKC